MPIQIALVGRIGYFEFHRRRTNTKPYPQVHAKELNYIDNTHYRADAEQKRTSDVLYRENFKRRPSDVPDE